MTITKNKRIDWIDTAKGLGIIFVTFGHAYPYALTEWLFPPLMPLFFFLSGYVFSCNVPFSTFIKKRIKTLLVPYIFLGIIVVLGYAIQFKQFNLDSLLNLTIGFIFQQRFLNIWFLPCLFILNVITYLLVKIYDNDYFLLFVSLISFLVGSLYYKYLNASLYWNIDICIMALPYFLIGYITKKRNYVDKYLINKKTNLLFISLLLIHTIAWYINYRHGYTLDMFTGDYGVVVATIVHSLAGIFWIIILSIKCKSEYIKYIGKNSILYYMLHQFVIFPIIQYIFEKIHLETYLNIIFNSNLIETMLVLAILKTVITIIVLTALCKLIYKFKLEYILGK